MGEVLDALARKRLPAWALIFAMSVSASGCSQSATNKPQAVNASVAPAASPEANAVPIAANAPANSISPTNAAASDTLPTAVTPHFSETFEQYRVSVFPGPPIYPDFAGAQKQYADYRTRL